MTKTKTTPAANQLALTLTVPVLSATSRDAHPSRDERLDAARAVLARGLSGVRDDPAAMAAFLAFRARFHTYSTRNALLLFMQRPTARYCMGFRTWTKYGRRVRKGERGLTVFAPILRRPNKSEIAAGTDPDDRTPVGYKTATTFDYEQTEAVTGDALVYVPPTPRLGTDAPDDLIRRLEAVAGSIGYTVRDTHLASYADGWCNWRERTITLQASLAGADRAAVLAHEVVHALAHTPDTETPINRTTRTQRELQAEAVSFVTLSALGLDTSISSLNYIKGWVGGDDNALLVELDAIDKIARDLLARIEAVSPDGTAPTAMFA